MGRPHFMIGDENPRSEFKHRFRQKATGSASVSFRGERSKERPQNSYCAAYGFRTRVFAAPRMTQQCDLSERPPVAGALERLGRAIDRLLGIVTPDQHHPDRPSVLHSAWQAD